MLHGKWCFIACQKNSLQLSKLFIQLSISGGLKCYMVSGVLLPARKTVYSSVNCSFDSQFLEVSKTIGQTEFIHYKPHYLNLQCLKMSATVNSWYLKL